MTARRRPGGRPITSMERELRQAIVSSGFEVHYQPLIHLRSRRVTRFEALVRWNNPERGLIPPNDFIPLAEATGLIGEIGRWVLARACRDASLWPSEIGLAVNVSAAQFDGTDLSAVVFETLAETGFPAARLELEITESVLMRSDEPTLAMLHRLRDAGVRIAIDDFGVGYSSFGTLARIPFDKIKIDRTFGARLTADPGSRSVGLSVIRAMIALCDSLGVTCTAEGVESEGYLDLLTRENCTEAQGFYFGRPAPAQSVAGVLARFNPAEPAGPARLPISQLPISFYQIAEKANDIIIVTTPEIDPPGPVITYVNPAFTRLTGYAPGEVIGLTPRILQGPGTSRTTLDHIRRRLLEGQEVHEKVLNYAKCGAPYWLDLRISALHDAAGRPTHFVAIERDVTLDKRRLDELELVANRDTLTGIPNRRALLRNIEAEIRDMQAQPAASLLGFCLAFVDVDHFKPINDSLGHATGDAVLFGIADRLADNIRRSDMLGRIGGEEFAVAMPEVSLPDAKALAERLHRAISAQPFDTPSGPIEVTVSIGVAAYQPGDTPETLMQRADAVMYRAKRSGRDKVLSDIA